MEFRNSWNFILSSLAIFFVMKYVIIFYYSFVAFATILVGIQVAEWCMTVTRKYIFWKAISPENKAVLITGCDSGFGNALARKLDKLGYSVFATCLDPNGEGAMKLIKDCSKKLKILHLNVTDEGSILQAKQFVEKNLGQNVLWAIVNNAGIAHVSEIDCTPIDEIQKIYDVNTAGTLRVTKCFLPFLKKSRGRIVNVTSQAGHFTSPGLVAYCMSKSAGIALTTGLRMELAKWGVKVISIEPFFYATRLGDMQFLYAISERIWKSAPKEIKEEYGEDYIACVNRMINMYLYGFSTKINEVIDCLEDAITANEPLPTYSPGPFILKFSTRITPTYIMEYFLKTLLDMCGKPSALTVNGKKNR